MSDTPRAKKRAPAPAAPAPAVEISRGIAQPEYTDLGRTLMNGYPGPIVLVDSGGQAVAVNDKATTLAAALNGPLRPQAIPLIARAAEAGAAQSNLLRLGDLKTSVAIDLTVIPMGPAGSVGLTFLALGRDATLDRNLRDALIESRRRYKDLVECSSDFVWETDKSGSFAFVTARGALGYVPDYLVGKPSRSFVDRRRRTPEPFPFESREPTEEVEVWLRDSHGEPACLIASSLPMFTQEGEWMGARGVCRDITEQRKRDEALAVVQAREQLLATMIKTIRDDVETGRLLETAGKALMAAESAAACWIYRPDANGVLQRAGGYGEAVMPPEIAVREVRTAIAEDRDPEFETVASLASPTHYRGTLNGAVAIARVDRRRWSDDDRILLSGLADQLAIAFEQIDTHGRLLDLANNDGLTGLLNHRAVVAALEQRLGAAAKTGGNAYFLYVDLDNFKAINDKLGHAQGDQALCAVAALLRSFVGERGVVGRLGGDEFLVWIDGDSPEKMETEIKALQARTSELATYSASPDLPLKFSIGAAFVSASSLPKIEALLAAGDEALYATKRNGKSGYTLASSKNTAKS